jgi:hypothetical protein
MLKLENKDLLVARVCALSYPVLRPKMNVLPSCVPESNFTHKAINSEINGIISAYYIES